VRIQKREKISSYSVHHMFIYISCGCAFEDQNPPLITILLYDVVVETQSLQAQGQDMKIEPKEGVKLEGPRTSEGLL